MTNSNNGNKIEFMYKAVAFLFESDYNDHLEVKVSETNIESIRANLVSLADTLAVGGKLRVSRIPTESREATAESTNKEVAQTASAVIGYATPEAIAAFAASKGTPTVAAGAKSRAARY